MGYAVIHIEKCNTTVTNLEKHIDRLIPVRNADASKMQLNCTLKGLEFKPLGEEKEKLHNRIQKRIIEGYKGSKSIRKDAVRALSVVLTGTHENMKAIEADSDKMKQWLKSNVEFLATEFGGVENIVDFTLHRDEKTPHVHAIVVPISEGRLCAKDYIGSPEKLRKIQTNYASEMAKFGLERGLSGSKARHEDVSEYYGRVNKFIEEMKTEVKDITLPDISLSDKSMLQSFDTWRANEEQKIAQNLSSFKEDVKSELSDAKDKIIALEGKLHEKTVGKDKEIKSKNVTLERLGMVSKVIYNAINGNKNGVVKACGELKAKHLNLYNNLIEGKIKGIAPETTELIKSHLKANQNNQDLGRF